MKRSEEKRKEWRGKRVAGEWRNNEIFNQVRAKLQQRL